MTNFTYSNELYHYGIPGMKWGIRNYQNADGSLTDAGRERYGRMSKKLEKLDQNAKKHANRVTSRMEAKAARYQRKSERYKLKAAKVRRGASRLLFPTNPAKAANKAAKFDVKSARYSNKASKIINKLAKEKYKADKYDAKAKKYAEKIQKEFGNVKISELASVGNYESDLLRVANVSERHGVKSREMSYVRSSNEAHHKENEKKLNQIQKKKPSELTDEEHDWLDNYVTTTNELYGHSADVTEKEVERANELGDKYINRYRHRTK